MRLPRNSRIFRGQWDVAPFAGVFFLILIMIVVCSPLVFQPGVSIELPLGDASSELEGPRLVVAIDQAGIVYYRNQAIDDLELRAQLASDARRIDEEATLVVMADARAAYEVILRVARLGREAGLKQAFLSTRTAMPPISVGEPRQP